MEQRCVPAAGAAEERCAAAPGVAAERTVTEHGSVGRNSTGTSEKKLCVDAKYFLVEFD